MNNSTPGTISRIIRRAVLECLATEQVLSTAPGDPQRLFDSPEAAAIKEEIIHTGRKLWTRQYVDGNGGNISARVSRDYVICTPTLCCKGDLKFDDLSLVDLENRQICGSRPQTSEILLHLEIYKAVPKATAVIHCHPPYATAHAVAGVVPQGNLIPEQEVFVGPVAISPYETPGTVKFARTVLPFVKTHNTILLGNHGVVCWADTVTHAEWFVEIVETYCKTLMIASQLNPRLKEIPPDKIAGLLAIKKKLGLPDPRLVEDAPGEAEFTGAIESIRQNHPEVVTDGWDEPAKAEIDKLVEQLTERVKAFLQVYA